ncbi:MAG: hypothetical protein ACI9OS_002564, partial [Ulvibacter sp.]
TSKATSAGTFFDIGLLKLRKNEKKLPCTICKGV